MTACIFGFVAFVATTSAAAAYDACLFSNSSCDAVVVHVSLLQTDTTLFNAKSQQELWRQDRKDPGKAKSPETRFIKYFKKEAHQLAEAVHPGASYLYTHTLAACMIPAVLVILFVMLTRSDHELLDGLVEKHLTSRGDVVDEDITWYRSFFLYHINRNFARHSEEAFRGTMIFLLYAVPFFLPEDKTSGLGHLIDIGVYSNFIGQQILFNYQTTLGATICMSAQTTCGTFLAVLTIWTMFGFFPHGVAGDVNGYTLIVGLACGVVFVLCMLWLNFPLKVKIFALARFSQYLMDFMNPAADVASHYSVGFTIKWTGTAMTAFMATIIGALLAVLANMLPYPCLALVDAEVNACVALGQVKRGWETFRTFMNDEFKRQDVMSMMQREMFKTKTHIDLCTRELEFAWWECWFSQDRARTRKVLDAVNKANWKMYVQLLGAIQNCTADDTFSDGHSEFMKQMKSLRTVIEYAGECNYTSAMYARNAGTKEETKYAGYFEDCIKKMSESITVLTKEFRNAKASMRIAPVDQEYGEEHVFCRCVCEFGRLSSDLSRSLSLDLSGEKRIVADYNGPDVFDIFNLKQICKREQALTAGRLCVTYALTFGIGYYGWSGIIKPYTFHLAQTFALLISPGQGLQLVKNLMRLEGVVLGSAIGSLIGVVFSSCSSMSLLGNTISITVWIWLNLVGYFMNREFSYLCFVLALFGQNKIVRSCGSELTVSMDDLVYHVVVTIGIMTLVDLLTPTQPASSQAAAVIEKAWSKLQTDVSDIFNGNQNENQTQLVGNAAGEHARKGDIRALISKAQLLGAAAESEPRFAKVPWRAQSYKCFVEMMRLTQSSLLSVSDLVESNEKVSRFIRQSETFHRLTATIREEMTELARLLVVFRHDRTDGIPELNGMRLQFIESSIHAEAVDTFAKDISRKHVDLSPDPQKPDSLEFDPAANVCQILTCFDSMKSAMAHFHTVVLKNG
jgi:hypothetical protein